MLEGIKTSVIRQGTAFTCSHPFVNQEQHQSRMSSMLARFLWKESKGNYSMSCSQSHFSPFSGFSIKIFYLTPAIYHSLPNSLAQLHFIPLYSFVASLTAALTLSFSFPSLVPPPVQKCFFFLPSDSLICSLVLRSLNLFPTTFLFHTLPQLIWVFISILVIKQLNFLAFFFNLDNLVASLSFNFLL